MSIIEPLIQQVLIMFLLMGMGYALNRLAILSEQAAIEFGKLLINLVIPAIILKLFGSVRPNLTRSAVRRTGK